MNVGITATDHIISQCGHDLFKLLAGAAYASCDGLETSTRCSVDPWYALCAGPSLGSCKSVENSKSYHPGKDGAKEACRERQAALTLRALQQRPQECAHWIRRGRISRAKGLDGSNRPRTQQAMIIPRREANRISASWDDHSLLGC